MITGQNRHERGFWLHKNPDMTWHKNLTKLFMQRYVLIIDDEVDECLLISQYLRRKGFRVDCAHTLESGIEKIRLTNPDSLLLDNNLPDGLGWKYASLLKSLFPDLQITLITAGDRANEPGDRLAQFQRLTKPMRLDQLEAYVKAA